ncbi:MAG: hypothetical protein AAGJ10_05705 [Bacteroidota bacterium]
MELLSFVIEGPIEHPLTHAIEVSVELTNGERRWCCFATPAALTQFGDWISGTQMRIHYGTPHLIILAEVTAATIEMALQHIDKAGDIREATREIDWSERRSEVIWVFNGANARLPSAVFRYRVEAEAWIALHKLTGMLTQYPVDASVYDWAIKEGVFTPRRDAEKSATFIERFTTAHQEHYHYEGGINLSSEST